VWAQDFLGDFGPAQTARLWMLRASLNHFLGPMLATTETKHRSEWIDPLTDPRWDTFVAHQANALPFHTSAWLGALVQTFGFASRAWVQVDEFDAICAACPFMVVRSAMRQPRLVSLPFSHRGGPLGIPPAGASSILDLVCAETRRIGARMSEIRGWPLNAVLESTGWQMCSRYFEHVLDVSLGPEQAQRGMSHGVRWSIRRAKRDGVSTRMGTSREDMEIFYLLYLAQRRQQKLIPQPEAFFKAIQQLFLDSGAGFVLIAEYQGSPVAGLLVLQHSHAAVASHSGATNEARRLHATHLLWWTLIESAYDVGITSVNLGRTQADDAGLLRFKEEIGCKRHELPYLCMPTVEGLNAKGPSAANRLVSEAACRLLPDHSLDRLSQTLYRYCG
jgi:hypothetical protein